MPLSVPPDRFAVSRHEKAYASNRSRMDLRTNSTDSKRMGDGICLHIIQMNDVIDADAPLAYQCIRGIPMP